ncbi:translation initiation factor IF-2 subunit beta [Haloarchaeobius sp. DFWS5]|uniref:translation initiation factor IF-2 subunit beta n=1 Tax=Haloarchaeobius sp. DFWS5 TaxID=3446114 RepID=UPI003EBB2976
MGYDDQLDRAIAQTDDEESSDERFSVPDPVVTEAGAATVYENVGETADALRRTPDHLARNLQRALGTSATVDDAGRARFAGSFAQARVADLLDEYVETYVRCDACGSPDTRLLEEGGGESLRCDACGTSESLPTE